MKKVLAILLALVTCLSLLVGCGQPAETPNEGAEEVAEAFTPEANGEWIITANVGSGFDNFTRAVINALVTDNITPCNLPVVSKPEGDGIVGMQYVAQLNNAKQYNNTLLTVGGEDVTEAQELAGFDPDSLQPLAIMAAEVPLLVRGKDANYATFADAVAAMQAGTQVVFCGPRNSYEDMANELRDAIGVTDEVFTYVPYDSGKEALTALMGGHAEFALVTPSHAAELIKSGDVDPQWVYNDAHYSFGDLVDLPTFEEYTEGQYGGLKFAIYRIVVASAKMEPAAVEYWLDCLKQASESEAWESFCADYSLISQFVTGDDVKAIW